MTSVLLISSSASGEGAVSHQITRAFVDALRRHEPDITVVGRNVGTDPLPHLTPERLPALFGTAETPPAEETAALSKAVVDEIKAADLVIIGSPMYNLGITSTLKAWFDHVARAGQTFQYTAEGPKGLLHGKRAVVVESRGGFYSEGPGKAMDHQEPHLNAFLGLIGITDVTFIRAEKLAISPEAKEASLAAALAEASALAGRMVGATQAA